MRIAVLDQHGNPGGGLRFVRALVAGLADAFPDDEIGLFASRAVLDSEPFMRLRADHPRVIAEEMAVVEQPAPRMLEEAAATLPALPIDDAPESEAPSGGALRAAVRRVKPLVWMYRRVRGLPPEEPPAVAPQPQPEPAPEPAPEPDPTFTIDDDLARRLAAYDLVYFAWPYYIEPRDLTVPVVGTFHDFNFKHGFGNYSDHRIELLERQIPGWLCRASAVVSTRFILGELERFYPDVATATEVIPLATFITGEPSPDRVAEMRSRFKLPDAYVIYPCNIALHKNIPYLFRAYGLLKAEGRSVPPLVLCGYGTDLIAGQMRGTIDDGHLASLVAELLGADLVVGEDVFLLGYVSDADIDALIAGATLVVSSSLYEAGSGPGLDAWYLGTPVALSAIPAHLEQVGLLGVAAAFFDPEDPADGAHVIATVCAGDTEEAVIRSREALHAYDWRVVARRYHETFERAVAAGAHTCG